MPAVAPSRYSADEYLALEASASTKHEYINGDIYAMAGASDAHVTVALNIATALKTHLRGSPCRVFISDMKLLVETSNAYFYPDVFVSCNSQDRGPAKTDAILVVEVLSPSTAAFDRGAKFAHYRYLPGLQEFLLVDPTERTADLYRRGRDGLWVLHPTSMATPHASIQLACVDMQLPMALVLEDVPTESTTLPTSL